MGEQRGSIDASEGSARSSVDPDTQYINKYADNYSGQADKKNKKEQGLTE